MDQAVQASVVSSDSGHSYYKVFDGEQKFISPSVVTRCRESFGSNEIIVDGERYLVGDAARTAVTSVNERPHLERNFHGGHAQHIQNCYALHLLKMEGTHELFVQSVPYSDSRDKELLERLKARKRFEWEAFDDDGIKVRRAVEFKRIEVVPQGIGAMQKYCDANPDDQPHCLMLVDIGSCTTDVVVIIRNLTTGQPDYCHQACRSIEHINADLFKQNWCQRLISGVRGLPHDKKFDFYDMMMMPVLNKWGIRVGDDVVDCRATFEATKAEFSETLVRALQAATGEIWGKIDRIILTGGGSALVSSDSFDSRLRHLGLWSNVEGQYSIYAEDEPESAGVNEDEDKGETV